MRHIVNPERLYAMWSGGDAVVVDCRFVMGQPQAGYDAYMKEHIPGAQYADLETELSAPVRSDGAGGRHPLPDKENFARVMAKLGVTKGKPVVAYDEQGGSYAARLWWLLSYFGYEEAYVLDGGFAAWKQAGYPTAEGAEPAPASSEGANGVGLNPRNDMVVTAGDIQAMRAQIEEGKIILIDSREDARYRGITEPIDKVAGHIPGARHMFWKGNLDAEGRFRPVKELMKRFEPLQGAEEIIVYCGSGVTACPNVLALREAGFKNVKLYAGSWSDWISDATRPVAKG